MSSVSRRSLISGALGAVVVGVFAQDAASAGSRESDDSRMCLVCLTGTELRENKIKAKKQDGTEVWVNPTGFPDEWTFQKGDILLYDSGTGEAWPHVQTQRTPQRRNTTATVWTALNTNRGRERTIAANPIQIGTSE